MSEKSTRYPGLVGILACMILMLAWCVLMYHSDRSTLITSLFVTGIIITSLTAWIILRLSSRLIEAEQEANKDRDTIDRAVDGILTTDELGRIQKVNPAAEAIFGYRESQLVGINFSSLFSADYADVEDGDLWDFLKRNALNSHGKTQEVKGIRHPSNETFYMDISISPFISDETTCAIIQVRDITQRKAAEQQLVQAHAGLEQRVLDRTTELQQSNERLRTEIELRKTIKEKQEKVMDELSQALKDIKILRGLIPICASCKSVRDDSGFWQQIEGYLLENSEAMFSHGICPDCSEKLYPEYSDKNE